MLGAYVFKNERMMFVHNNKASTTIQTVGTVVAIGASIAADMAASTLLKTYMPPQSSKVKGAVVKLGIAAISAAVSSKVFDSINTQITTLCNDIDKEYEKALNELMAREAQKVSDEVI